MNAETLVRELYQSVDHRSLTELSIYLAENVRFRIANHAPLVGKTKVLEANRSFFASVAGMRHRIDNVWSQAEDVICNGQVEYIRLNGTEFSAPFATILKVRENHIIDYLVYADISEL